MSDENPAQADDVRQMVYDVVRVWLDNTDAGRFTNEVTNAVLSVPAVAAVFARDTQVREIVERSGRSIPGDAARTATPTLPRTPRSTR